MVEEHALSPCDQHSMPSLFSLFHLHIPLTQMSLQVGRKTLSSSSLTMRLPVCAELFVQLTCERYLGNVPFKPNTQNLKHVHQVVEGGWRSLHQLGWTQVAKNESPPKHIHAIKPNFIHPTVSLSPSPGYSHTQLLSQTAQGLGFVGENWSVQSFFVIRSPTTTCNVRLV